MRYYLVAGEASGDLHGSLLAKELLALDGSAVLRFVGGDLMASESKSTPFMHYRDMAFMGFLEVFMHLPEIFRNLKKVREDILAFMPDILVLIDYPGFNLRLAAALHKLGVRIFYFISPKVWAWNPKRVLKIKRDIDRMFVIFPFEVAFYQKWGMEVDYVGNPLMDAIENFKSGRMLQAESRPHTIPVVALLPGSRKQEICLILPEMLQSSTGFAGVCFKVAKAPGLDREFYAPFLKDYEVELVDGHTYELLAASNAALVTSGTATLETALLGIPEVVLYKTSPVSFLIAKAVIKVKFISLVNLVMDREIVKELIQQDCRSEAIALELRKLLEDSPDRRRMLENYRELGSRVGGSGAAARAARLMFAYLKP